MRIILTGLTAAIMAVAMPASASQATEAAPASAPLPVSAYAQLPANEFISISPSGNRLAMVTVQGDQRALLVYGFPAMDVIGGARIGETKVRAITWVGEDYILATTSSTQTLPFFGAGRSELYQGQIYDIRERRIVPLFQRLPDVLRLMLSAGYVRTINGQPHILFEGVRTETTGEFTANLYAVNPRTMNGYVVEEGDLDVERYAIDQNGLAIARSDYSEREGRWSLEMKQNGRWPSVFSIQTAIDTPIVVGVGPDGRTAVVWARRGDDQEWKPWLVDSRGAWSPTPFEGSPGSLVYHPRTRTLIGARYDTDEGVRYVFSDPAAATVWRRIESAFHGRSPVLTSWNEDFSKVVIYTSGSRDSGTFQFVDIANRRAEILGEEYPGITTERVGEIRDISYAAADGMQIPGYLTLPPGVTEPRGLPLVVLPHGGPAERDYRVFDWWAQAMASRGYAVLQPNFRGSDGFGAAHLEAGYGEWGRKMQTDLSDGVRWLAGQGIIDPAKVCIVGASYGGYAALAGVTIDPGVYRCAVSVAGVSDLRRMLRWTANRSGRNDSQSMRYWGRFMDADGGDRSLDARSPALQAARADAPILLIHGREDTVVPFDQSTTMANALRGAGKPVELVQLDGEDHWLSRPQTRQQMLTATLAFLEEHNPPR